MDIRNSADIIDSRDIIERYDELVNAGPGQDIEDIRERVILRALIDEGETLVDWNYGVALIRDTYFEDYARELAEDIGAINRDDGWPAYCIDWAEAARDLQGDYTAIEYDGVTYWAR